MKMPYRKGLKLIKEAIERESEQRLWEQYISVYPYMSLRQLKFMKFEDFKNIGAQKQVNKTSKTTQQLIFEAAKIRKADKQQFSKKI